MLLADRGYDADWIRELAIRKRAWANIKSNRNKPICFQPIPYRARNIVERFFNRIKQCRPVATRYDKLAANYLAFVQLASNRLWLRANPSTPCLRQPDSFKARESPCQINQKRRGSNSHTHSVNPTGHIVAKADRHCGAPVISVTDRKTTLRYQTRVRRWLAMSQMLFTCNP